MHPLLNGMNDRQAEAVQTKLPAHVIHVSLDHLDPI